MNLESNLDQKLDQQMQALIDNAPQDGQTPLIMQAIAPVLKHFATRLQRSQYYILQSSDQSWLVTTLSNRSQPELEKNVIYAFSTLKDSHNLQLHPDPQILTLVVPVLHILFQMFAMTMVDSMVFFETPGDIIHGTEVSRPDLESAIQRQLQQIGTIYRNSPNSPPPNIA